MSSPTATTPLLGSDNRGNGSRDDLVELTGPNDCLNPQNSMSPARKWLSALLLGAMTFSATFSSAVFAAVGPGVAQELGATPEQMTLATSLFVLGFAAGPVIMSPASELYGRKLPLFVGYVAFVVSQVPVARAHDAQTILIWRFVGGVASSGSPAIVGGYLADFLRPVERGVAVAIFAATTLIGPSIGAIVGAALLDSPLGWRWAAWLSMVLGVAFGLPAYAVVPETYLPVLLTRKARKLRFETRKWALHSKAEESPVTLGTFATKYLTRPFAMLAQEPILVLMTLYVSFTFGMIYCIFVAYTFSFVRERHFTQLHGALPLLAIVMGIILGSFYVSRYTLTVYSRKVRNGGPVTPEDRLPPMIVGGAILPLGLFCFAATSSPDVSAWPQILSGGLIGAGIQIVTLQSLAYVLDIYTVNANSAIAGTVIVRSILGGFLPLLAVPMYGQLGQDAFFAATSWCLGMETQIKMADGLAKQWHQASPGVWERSFGENEQFIKFIGDRAHPFSREQWSVTATATYKLEPLGRIVDAQVFREAWKLLRFRHPSIAARDTEDGKLQYHVPDAEGLTRWLEKSFFVVEDTTIDANGLIAGLKPSPVATIHHLPHFCKVVLHTAHWRTDGYGAFQLIDAFFASLATVVGSSSNSSLAWGSEVNRLVPSLESILRLPAEASPEVDAAAKGWLATGMLVSGTVGLETPNNPTIRPGGTKYAQLTISPEDTKKLEAASHDHGFSLHSAVHAAVAGATYAHAAPGDREKHYTSTIRLNLRPQLPQPYDSPKAASGLFTGGFLHKVPACYSFLQNSQAFEAEYAAGVSDEFVQSRRHFAKMALERLRTAPPQPPANSNIDVSFVRHVDSIVTAARGTSGGGTLEVVELGLGVETLTRQPYCFFWVFRGMLQLYLWFNEAYYDGNKAQRILEVIRDDLVKGLLGIP
ncbi:hypothetical protein S7711_09356 [Stachybotrys chartarum IBT 7711]|uniref:Major facilitator superfamily (MFS) profile domain-containing protein n=1 Tax=Stachybotrys chartarum (strain CBS 109288 / IBT 7711) TaxID=1280523 RepID=A0A084AYK3_STACB|nr:hypothetical protein S7711_09356 [Stachybotrys chartarum IBT 7711]